VLIPDTLLLELIANGAGQEVPLTYGLKRDDGRMVHVFRAPREWQE
jgi:hypothetical protein